MWKEDRSRRGEYYQLDEPPCGPQPMSQPYPPILVGGEVEEGTLRLIVKYADAINLQLGIPLKGYTSWLRDLYEKRKENLTRKLNKLKEYCDEIGPPYENIERTVIGTIRLTPGAMTSAEVLGLCRELAEMGFHHAIFNMHKVHGTEPVEIISHLVIPQVADMS
jgi:hypothetical protein